ncbi:MAG: FAD-dependent oxidoreductase [Candidatus Gracilibacteria bacterium]|jgi:CDP-4-dehydro-6-deoxyglucose reductase
MAIQTAVLTKKTQLTNDVIEFSFETKDRFEFQAGQFISIKITDNQPSPCIRGYSIASAPNKNSNKFTLCVKIIENGRGSNWLNALKQGDEIQFLGPNGKFFPGENLTEVSLFIATGTGIAPLKAIIEDQLLNKNTKTKLHLIFGVRYIKDIFYENIFKNLAEKFQNFTYEITISRPENPDWKGNIGRVTAILKNLQIDPENTQAYLCGLKDMLDETTLMLEAKGLSPENIHKEQFD